MQFQVHFSKRVNRRIKCKKKVQYKTVIEAERDVARYHAQVLFSNLDAYWCPVHRLYHKGHNRFMPNAIIVTKTQDLKPNTTIGE